MRRLTLIAALVCAALPLSSAFAQPPGTARRAPATPESQWPMETLRLKDGRLLRGLVQSNDEGVIEFVEIVRPPGRPMFCVLHPISPREVEELTTLPREEHEQLVRRFEQFRHRARIEAGRMEELMLREESRDGQAWRIYEGPWFTLESTADDEITRRCIVRIEQTFRAYRLLLPPRDVEPGNLRVVLLGSMDEYRGYLQNLRLEISNPAYYSIVQNRIVAGSDLSLYAVELAEARRQCDAIRREYVELDRSLGQRLKQLSDEMRSRGFQRDEIRAELQTRRAAWSAEMQRMNRKLDEIERRNNARFAQVTRDMFRRLRHEAFHAYLENYVYPQGRGELPRWLNEGLAQIFEHGQLESESLRVDAPSRELLERLQDDLRSSQPLPLADLLNADGRQFITSHANDSTDRSYLYAWGLAWHLTFDEQLLYSRRLDEYAATSGASDRVARFEKLVGRPLADFEADWRKAMLGLRGPR